MVGFSDAINSSGPQRPGVLRAAEWAASACELADDVLVVSLRCAPALASGCETDVVGEDLRANFSLTDHALDEEGTSEVSSVGYRVQEYSDRLRSSERSCNCKVPLVELRTSHVSASPPARREACALSYGPCSLSRSALPGNPSDMAKRRSSSVTSQAQTGSHGADWFPKNGASSELNSKSSNGPSMSREDERKSVKSAPPTPSSTFSQLA